MFATLLITVPSQKIKGPFNTDDRLTAGMTADYYTDLEGFAVSRWQASQDKPTQTSGEKTVPTVNRQHEEGDLRIHPRLT